MIGYAPGAYDLFHVGHLNILKHAAEHCDHLIAGVVSDEMLLLAKGRAPVVPLAERMEIVRNLRFVDDVHAEVVPGQDRHLARGRLRRHLQGRRLARDAQGRPARAGLRRGRRRGAVLPVHDAHLEHDPAQGAGRHRRRGARGPRRPRPHLLSRSARPRPRCTAVRRGRDAPGSNLGVRPRRTRRQRAAARSSRSETA